MFFESAVNSTAKHQVSESLLSSAENLTDFKWSLNSKHWRNVVVDRLQIITVENELNIFHPYSNIEGKLVIQSAFLHLQDHS